MVSQGQPVTATGAFHASYGYTFARAIMQSRALFQGRTGDPQSYVPTSRWPRIFRYSSGYLDA